MRSTNLAVVIILLAIGCRKSEPNESDSAQTVPPIIELGKVSVKRDGTLWDGPFKAKLFSNYSPPVFVISSKVKDGDLEESFYINDIPTVAGHYSMEGGSLTWGNLRPQASMSWIIIDQFLGIIYADTAYSDNYVEVIRYDSINRIVEGRFQMHLGDFWPSNSFGLPDSMNLTDGKFHLQLEE